MLRPGLTPEQVLGFVLLDIAIILVVARLFGKVANKVGQPTVVGEILAGIALGPSLLGAQLLVWENSWSFLNCEAALSAQLPGTPIPPEGTPAAVETISGCLFPPQAQGVLGIIGQLALVFFMFLVGLELDWDLLKGKGRKIALVAFGAVAVPIGLAFVVGPIIYGDDFKGMAADQSSFTWFVAAMLAVTAFPVMARILQEKGLTASPMGSTGIAAAAIVTVLMFLTVAVAAGVANEAGPSTLALKFLWAGVYIAALFLVARPALAPLGRSYERTGRLTPLTFGVIMAFTFASAYIAHQLGINVIVGAFLAGAVLPARKGLYRELAGRLADVTAVILLPIFLAFSGLRTDFTKLSWDYLPAIALFLAAGIVGKWAGSAVFARLGGMSWAEGNVLGVLMNCRGLLVLVVALIALNAGVISPPMQVAGVLMALVTTMMTGPLVDRFLGAVPDAGGVGPATPGVARIVAVATSVEEAAPVASAAFRLARQRGGEVVLFRPIALSPYDELPAGLGAGVEEVERSLRALKLVATLAPEGVTVTPAAYGAVDPAAAVAELAGDADLVVLVAPQHAPSGTVARIADRSPVPVVIADADAPVERAGPVVVLDDHDHVLVATTWLGEADRRSRDDPLTDAAVVVVAADAADDLSVLRSDRGLLILVVRAADGADLSSPSTASGRTNP